MDLITVLTLLYNATNGAQWADNSGWLSGDPCGSPPWNGLKCNNGKLVELDLSKNLLRGTIISQLGELSDLTSLKLFENPQLTGSLPSQVFEMSAIQSIDLSRCGMSSTLPSALGTATLLQTLLLAGDNNLHQFSGTLPSEIGFARSLLQLNIGNNAFTGPLPTEIGRLTRLVSLNLQGNRFNGFVPTQLGALSALTQEFTIANNRFEGTVPTQLGFLVHVANSFDLSYNYLFGPIPSELGKLTALQNSFYLEHNSLSGTVPSALGALTNLASGFVLRNNQLTGPLPSELGALTKLTTNFDITYNRFCDDFPPEVLALKKNEDEFFVYSEGNDFGKPCCELDTLPVSYSCAPSLSPSTSPRPTPSPSTGPPSVAPSPAPTSTPSRPQPTRAPSLPPTGAPTTLPQLQPTSAPTVLRTGAPTPLPLSQPSPAPSSIPSPAPTSLPSSSPTLSPSPKLSTQQPSQSSTRQPAKLPTQRPNTEPIGQPTLRPTRAPDAEGYAAAPIDVVTAATISAVVLVCLCIAAAYGAVVETDHPHRRQLFKDASFLSQENDFNVPLMTSVSEPASAGALYPGDGRATETLSAEDGRGDSAAVIGSSGPEDPRGDEVVNVLVALGYGNYLPVLSAWRRATALKRSKNAQRGGGWGPSRGGGGPSAVTLFDLADPELLSDDDLRRGRGGAGGDGGGGGETAGDRSNGDEGDEGALGSPGMDQSEIAVFRERLLDAALERSAARAGSVWHSGPPHHDRHSVGPQALRIGAAASML